MPSDYWLRTGVRQKLTCTTPWSPAHHSECSSSGTRCHPGSGCETPSCPSSCISPPSLIKKINAISLLWNICLFLCLTTSFRSRLSRHDGYCCCFLSSVHPLKGQALCLVVDNIVSNGRLPSVVIINSLPECLQTWPNATTKRGGAESYWGWTQIKQTFPGSS